MRIFTEIYQLGDFVKTVQFRSLQQVHIHLEIEILNTWNIQVYINKFSLSESEPHPKFFHRWPRYPAYVALNLS